MRDNAFSPTLVKMSSWKSTWIDIATHFTSLKVLRVELSSSIPYFKYKARAELLDMIKCIKQVPLLEVKVLWSAWELAYLQLKYKAEFYKFYE